MSGGDAIVFLILILVVFPIVIIFYLVINCFREPNESKLLSLLKSIR